MIVTRGFTYIFNKLMHVSVTVLIPISCDEANILPSCLCRFILPRIVQFCGMAQTYLEASTAVPSLTDQFHPRYIAVNTPYSKFSLLLSHAPYFELEALLYNHGIWYWIQKVYCLTTAGATRLWSWPLPRHTHLPTPYRALLHWPSAVRTTLSNPSPLLPFYVSSLSHPLLELSFISPSSCKNVSRSVLSSLSENFHKESSCPMSKPPS